MVRVTVLGAGAKEWRDSKWWVVRVTALHGRAGAQDWRHGNGRGDSGILPDPGTDQRGHY